MSDQETVRAIAKQFLRKVKPGASEQIQAECPFHVSDNPHGSVTFAMSASRGIFYCFSCHASGNLEKFLRDIGVAPLTVELQYKQLLDRLRLSAPPPKDIRKFDPHVNEPLPENLLGIFDYCPTRLLEVGFTEKTLRSFDIGYDPYHNMVTFPLRDVDGHLVGISGRRPEGEGPRYKIYDKEYMTWGLPAQRKTERSVLLWNAHRAAPECSLANRPIIVTEGFKACMWVWQCGFTNVVALTGSNITLEQMWILEQLGAPVVLMLDGDAAGRDGTVRSGRRLEKALNVRVARIPEEEQPDDLSIEQVTHAIEEAVVFQLWASKQPRGTPWSTGTEARWARMPR